MNAPPKEKRAVGSALKTAQLTSAYRLLNVLQAPFAWAFWFIEQRKAKLQDWVANQRSIR
jgi:hypothetical protein